MTHRDGLPRFSARSVGRGDAAHREARATPSESLGKPPLRSPPRPVWVIITARWYEPQRPSAQTVGASAHTDCGP